jgi:protein-S-isoprenylcysteine O-methyltransferase Ste14
MTRIRRHLVTSALVLLFVLFAWANLTATLRTGSPTGVGLTIIAAWTSVLFLFRRDPLAVSGRPVAWVAASVGTFADLLARPIDATGGTHVAGELLQIVGVALAIVSLGALGRSFGLVAANRGIQIRGAYRLVRHPVYTSYLIGWAGYVLESPALRNVVVFAVAVAAQLVRIREEEAVLGCDERYRRYMNVVRARLVPFVY